MQDANALSESRLTWTCDSLRTYFRNGKEEGEEGDGDGSARDWKCEMGSANEKEIAFGQKRIAFISRRAFCIA